MVLAGTGNEGIFPAGSPLTGYGDKIAPFELEIFPSTVTIANSKPKGGDKRNQHYYINSQLLVYVYL